MVSGLETPTLNQLILLNNGGGISVSDVVNSQEFKDAVQETCSRIIEQTKYFWEGNIEIYYTGRIIENRVTEASSSEITYTSHNGVAGVDFSIPRAGKYKIEFDLESKSNNFRATLTMGSLRPSVGPVSNGSTKHASYETDLQVSDTFNIYCTAQYASGAAKRLGYIKNIRITKTG